MEHMRVRTDLALEVRESFAGSDTEVHGVVVEEDYDEERDIRLTRVRIESERGAREMGKPMGSYLTLEAPAMAVPDEDYHREISEALAFYIKELMGEERERSILVAGLGNRDVTPDALGPKTVSNLLITRHLIREYGKSAMGEGRSSEISGIVPGVMAQTGMETSEIIKGVVEQTRPELLIVIDALAARSTKRLSRTIQLTDTGIQPGSGVGNHRGSLTKENLGIPVIAIGVPTVVEAAAIVYDAQGNCEQMPPHLNGMFVTPKNIDETIKQLSFTLSEALNIAFQVRKEA
ncbi:MAG: GPR endopeptidase [Eubacteriales bacterium]|nr:GPR endopeptidase [Eubacteriales bacterium]